MIQQQSLSEIDGVLLVGTPLQLVQQILRVKHEEDRMNNLYFKDFLKHFEPRNMGPTPQQIRSKDILDFANTQQRLSCYHSMQHIIISIKGTILARAISDKFYPKFANPFLNVLTVRRKHKIEPATSSHKKLSIRTASTRKSEENKQLKRVKTVTVRDTELAGKKRTESQESILSKINHDLSQMIQDSCSQQTKQKNFSLKFHKNSLNKLKNSNQKEKYFKRKLMQENISQIKPNEDVKLLLAKSSEVDENYGLSVIKNKNKISSSRQRKNYKFKSSKNEEKSSKKKSTTEKSIKTKISSGHELFEVRSIERGALSPMTPKPRLLQQFAKQTVWKDYSINYNRQISSSGVKAYRDSNKSRSKEVSKVSSQKGLMSPRNPSKLKTKTKEKQKLKTKVSKKQL